jgi:hypothetical protein
MFSLITLILSLFFSQLPAHAFKADHFKGIYEVFSEHIRSTPRADKKYVVVDVDTVANIWAKYAEGDLPADLQPIKDEGSILVGFTFRGGLFFNLERTALIGDSLSADDANCVATILALAAGDLSEPDFTAWLRRRATPL